MEKTVLNAIIVFGKIIALVAQFPTQLTIYEFGSRLNAFGGLTWHEPYPPYRANPYPNSTNGNIAHLFQYLSPELPESQFPVKQFTVCLNMNIRSFQKSQDVIMRLFINNNTEWAQEPNDYWFQVNYSGDRGSIILRTAEWRENKTRKHVWSGGLGIENTTSEYNPFMRWGSFCFAMDTKHCTIRYFIGKLSYLNIES